MKAFISIDMEGICGVVREIETDPIKGGEAYQQSRHLMTQEANAAIEGCVKAGGTDILIADSHWNFDNLIPEELHGPRPSSGERRAGSRWWKRSTHPRMQRCSSDIMPGPARRVQSSITHIAGPSRRCE